MGYVETVDKILEESKNSLEYIILHLECSSPRRLYFLLRRHNINTVEELSNYSYDEIMKLRHIGKTYAGILLNNGLIKE